MSETIRPSVAVSEVSTARFAAALAMCIRAYRHATLDCPLAAAIIALHGRRRPRGVAPPGRRRMKDTIRRFLLGEASRVDAVYLEAAAACRRTGGPLNCPLRCDGHCGRRPSRI
jgi:hypothetical protein